MPFGSEHPETGVGLALSGGGFRAVLFHCGALIRCYRNKLGLDVKLRDLDDRGPRFVFNSTNYASGVTFRFSKPYCGDYRIGLIEDHDFDVALAVACSSALPPVLAPIVIDSNPAKFRKTSGTCLTEQLGRIRDIGLNQSRALRKRMLIDALNDQHRGVKGAYWGIGTNIAAYRLADAIPVAAGTSEDLAQIRTRLNRFTEEEQDHLINWGYAVCDAAIRKHAPQLVARQQAPAQPRQEHPVA